VTSNDKRIVTPQTYFSGPQITAIN